MQQVIKQQQNYTYTCTECGNKYTTHRKARGSNNVCSTTECRKTMLTRIGTERAQKAQDAKPKELAIRYNHPEIAHLADARKSLIAAKRTAVGIARRSPLRRAIETRDADKLKQLLPTLTAQTAAGCMEWPKTNADGYPAVKWSNTRLHRLVLETVIGKPLGAQPAHHKCANRSCVNPEHLQPVTHAENIAEMLSRRAYQTRISELEEALRELAPDHAVLNRAAYDLVS